MAMTSIIGKYTEMYKKIEWETLMTLGFYLHLSLIKVIFPRNDEFDPRLITQCYKFDQTNTPVGRKAQFETFFESNQSFFEQITDQIQFINNKSDDVELAWLAPWIKFCHNLRTSEPVDTLVETAGLIDSKLQLTDSLKSMVHFFVLKSFSRVLDFRDPIIDS